MKIVLTGGGTAGHVYPAINVGKKLKEMYHAELHFIGNKKHIEEKIAIEHNIPFYDILSKGFEGRNIWEKYIGFSFKNTLGIIKAIQLLKKIKPDMVFATGGFVSAPVLMACLLLHIPFSIHEQNSVFGKVNKLFRKYAKRVFCSFPVIEANQVLYTGNPVRYNEKLKENGEKIVVIGGSGGSQKLNLETITFAKRHPEIPILLITGKDLYEKTKKIKEEEKVGDNLELISYISEMISIYQQAKIIVCRAGAGTIFEIANLNIPSIFVPLPTSANGHQKQNALFFAQEKAAIMIEEDSNFEQMLNDTLLELWKKEEKRNELKKNLLSFAKNDCGTMIAQEIMEITHTKTSQIN